MIEGDNYVFDRDLYDQHEKFAGLWDKNLPRSRALSKPSTGEAHKANRFPVMGGRSKCVRSRLPTAISNRSKGAIP